MKALARDQKNVVRASGWRVNDNLSVNETSAGTNVPACTDLYDPALDGSFPVAFVTPSVTRRTTNVVIDVDHYHQPQLIRRLVVARRHWQANVSADSAIDGGSHNRTARLRGKPTHT